MARHQIRTDFGTIELNLERTDAKVEGEKRQAAPYKLVWRCPSCGIEHEVDFAEGDYFGYPIFGEPEDFGLWCAKCEIELTFKIRVDITLEVVVGG